MSIKLPRAWPLLNLSARDYVLRLSENALLLELSFPHKVMLLSFSRRSSICDLSLAKWAGPLPPRTLHLCFKLCIETALRSMYSGPSPERPRVPDQPCGNLSSSPRFTLSDREPADSVLGYCCILAVSFVLSYPRPNANLVGRHDPPNYTECVTAAFDKKKGSSRR